MRDSKPVLLYHYENPVFAGKPWPARFKAKKRKCVKVNYSLEDVRKEIGRLRRESSRAAWSFSWCAPCQGYHVKRH